MKLIFLGLSLALVVSCNTLSEPKVADVSKNQSKVSEGQAIKEEDCDEKAKAPIEIKEETISLSGNTGCSLDEKNP